jgi:hypothetical protein
MERVDEMVEVLVRFARGQMQILRFYWQGRTHEVVRTTIRLERKDGGREFWCFGVETQTLVAELALEKAKLIWRLVGVAGI